VALAGALEARPKTSSATGKGKEVEGEYVLVQRELDKPILHLRESLAFGKEVFLGIAKL